MWPPRAKPKVTAGLTWPPEMLAPTETATNRAKPWQIATATNPAGSRAASDVNLAATNQLEQVRVMFKLRKHKYTTFLISVCFADFCMYAHKVKNLCCKDSDAFLLYLGVMFLQ